MTTDRKAYRQARKLARLLGCKVEIEQMGTGPGSYRNYWVHGPDAVYRWDGEAPERADPREGDHCCIDWGEVLTALEAYRLDLLFAGLGITDEDTARVLALDRQRLAEQAVRGDTLALSVLADQLEEAGHQALADLLRGGK